MVITTDASLLGWGCDCEGVQSGGLWLPEEKQLHINVLEIKAAFFGLQCFLRKISSKHARLMIDNTTAWALIMQCPVLVLCMSCGCGA